MTQIAPLGSWKSPITTDLIVAGTIGLSSITIDDNDVYWLEGRPSEGGRNVIVRYTPDGQTTDITPPAFNVRTRVHEYGGGAFLVADGTIYFSNFADQRLYSQIPGTEPQPLTPSANLRYADAVIDKQRDRLICIQEDHTMGGEPVNRIVSINLKNGEDIQILAEDYDFYASPRLSTDGSKLCWISWNHPNMPWDGTELWVAQVKADGLLDENEKFFSKNGKSLFSSQIKSLGFVILAIFIMFVILFRSLKLSIIGIIPNIFASTFILGLIGLLKIPLDIMTITIAAISIGIAVDNTIHYIYRYKENLKLGRNQSEMIEKTHLTVGNAVLITSIAITAGFLTLCLSNFVPTVYFGLFTSLAMIFAMIGVLITLPSILKYQK